jgi:hypothetical protein
MIYHVYIDWTCEERPRPFYVGKGSPSRVKQLFCRNRLHESIVKKHGLRREVVITTSVEHVAFDEEVRLIAELRTFVHGEGYVFGANFTLGGDGASGAKRSNEFRRNVGDLKRGHHPSAESRKKMSDSAKKRPKMKDSTRAIIADQVRHRVITEETRQKLRNAGLGRRLSTETKAKISATLKGKA